MNLFLNIFLLIFAIVSGFVIAVGINANAYILICIDGGFLDARESHLQNGTCTCHAFWHHESAARIV
jgi:hypothetical protein